MNGYFEGWYLKQTGKDGTVAIIPSFCQRRGKIVSNIQIITDESSINFEYGNCKIDRKNGVMSIGRSIFTKHGFILDAEGEHTAFGSIKFSKLTPPCRDIMGPFGLLPNMECKHSVFSMFHSTSGSLTIDGKTYDFNGGRGYFEGDRGKSFPEKYVWTQGANDKYSVMMAAATIPIGSGFTGVIASVMTPKREYRFATYNGAKLVYANENGFCIRRGNTQLTAEQQSSNPRPLAAPKAGALTRTIHESPSCRVRYKLTSMGCVLNDFYDDTASFEFML